MTKAFVTSRLNLWDPENYQLSKNLMLIASAGDKTRKFSHTHPPKKKKKKNLGDFCFGGKSVLKIVLFIIGYLCLVCNILALYTRWKSHLWLHLSNKQFSCRLSNTYPGGSLWTLSKRKNYFVVALTSSLNNIQKPSETTLYKRVSLSGENKNEKFPCPIFWLYAVS